MSHTSLRILYAGQLSANDSALYRAWALERLGHSVIQLNSLDYLPTNRWARAFSYRTGLGPSVSRLNHDLLALACQHQPHILWADKLLWLQPSTLRTLRAMGITTLSYNPDNCFGPRQDPGWRLYRLTIPLFDLHVTPRDINLAPFRNAGARDVFKVQFAYEPTLQFPPTTSIDDSQRSRIVSFIGTPYDDRAQQLLALWQRFGISITINGAPGPWSRALPPAALAALFQQRELFRDEYRKAIWHSRINLAFITHSNQDEFAHKSFEIAACGGFLLAERSQGHLDRFVEDQEAVFFTGVDELAAKIQRYLPDEAARNRIAAAGCARAHRSGYDNDTQVRRILEYVEKSLHATLAPPTTEASQA